ncbi:hypothetical protein [Staphylococcus delphini]|uniref:hypothetical protein n=1 Tax=Staphylococcus delphini TaxID=53344 RepID=UPI0002D3C061|nr:hypothetical protein [Staphylococcus delphini]
MQFWLKFICFILASILIAHFIWNEMITPTYITVIVTLVIFSIIEHVFKKKEKK